VKGGTPSLLAACARPGTGWKEEGGSGRPEHVDREEAAPAAWTASA
jgi:hypothetical protein